MLNLKKRLITLPNAREAFELMKVFEQCYNTQCLTSAGLVAGGAVATWSTGNVVTFILNNVLMTRAALAAQAIPAAAALTSSGFQAVLITIGLVADPAGSGTPSVQLFTGPVATSANSAADALGKVVPPMITSGGTNAAPIGDGVVVIGQILIQSAATTFTPGVTLLNAAGITVTPINIVGPFFPVSPI